MLGIVSSLVERLVYTENAGGSIPSRCTMPLELVWSFSTGLKSQGTEFDSRRRRQTSPGDVMVAVLVLETSVFDVRVRVSPGAPTSTPAELTQSAEVEDLKSSQSGFESQVPYHTPVGKLAKPSLSKGEEL